MLRRGVTEVLQWVMQMGRWLERHRLAGVVGLIGAAALTWVVTSTLDATANHIEGAVSGGPPVTASVRTNAVDYAQSQYFPGSWVLPLPPSGIPNAPPEWEGGRQEWAHRLGGVDAESTWVEIVVQGSTEAAIVLQDLLITVLDRQPPMQGTFVEEPGGDFLDVLYLDVELDDASPEVVPEGWSFPLRVSSHEPEVLMLSALTDTCDCSWVGDLLYVHEGEQLRLRVDDNGRPFRTTGVPTRAPELAILADGSLEAGVP